MYKYHLSQTIDNNILFINVMPLSLEMSMKCLVNMEKNKAYSVLQCIAYQKLEQCYTITGIQVKQFGITSLCTKEVENQWLIGMLRQCRLSIRDVKSHSDPYSNT